MRQKKDHIAAPPVPESCAERNRVGRPRSGTEAERLDLLLVAATTIFLKEGYELTSIAKIARAAGVSTRTIYEKFSNKSALLVEVVKRLAVNELTSVIEDAVLDKGTPERALTTLGNIIVARTTSAEATSLYRLGLAEVARIPDLAKKVVQAGPMCAEALVAKYLEAQMRRGTLQMEDPVEAAQLFISMIAAIPLQHALFGLTRQIGQQGLERHIQSAVRLFLHGTMPRDQ